MLLAGERVRRRSEVRALAVKEGLGPDGEGRRLDTLEYREAGVVGAAQSLALFAGISRSGITMVAGLVRGLDHEDAAKFAFLLATPVIFAAGAYKVPVLFGHLGNGIRGQILVGSIVAGVASYISARYLTRYFKTRTLTPVRDLLPGGRHLLHRPFADLLLGLRPERSTWHRHEACSGTAGMAAKRSWRVRSTLSASTAKTASMVTGSMPSTPSRPVS